MIGCRPGRTRQCLLAAKLPAASAAGHRPCRTSGSTPSWHRL